MSWNINALKNKIEKGDVLGLLTDYDVSLNETKTQCHISVPGYFSMVSRDSAYLHRGGTCVQLKDHLRPYVTEAVVPDRVWF